MLSLISLKPGGSSTFTHSSSTFFIYGFTSASFSVLISTASMNKFFEISEIFSISDEGEALNPIISGFFAFFTYSSAIKEYA